MSWIARQIAGAFGGWILAGAVAVTLAMGGAAGFAAARLVDRGEIAGSQVAAAQAGEKYQACVARRETDRADENARAALELKTQVISALAADRRTAEQEQQRRAAAGALLEKLQHVPSTKACVASPAFVALFDSLRERAAANADAPGG
jgi:hypothetical protein